MGESNAERAEDFSFYSKDDVLVGEPFYTEYRHNAYEIGRVHIFYQRTSKAFHCLLSRQHAVIPYRLIYAHCTNHSWERCHGAVSEVLLPLLAISMLITLTVW